jgi:hypothetical protein
MNTAVNRTQGTMARPCLPSCLYRPAAHPRAADRGAMPGAGRCSPPACSDRTRRAADAVAEAIRVTVQ